MKKTAAPSSATALQQRWQRLASREKNLVLVAGSLVAAALIWWLALAPALQTLRQAPVRHRALDAQLQAMQQMQAQALQLQAERRPLPSEPAVALQAATAQELPGKSQIQVTGDRATLTVLEAPADSLLRWLAQARGNARALPIEVRLTRATADGPGAPVRWNGRIVLAISNAPR